MAPQKPPLKSALWRTRRAFLAQAGASGLLSGALPSRSPVELLAPLVNPPDDSIRIAAERLGDALRERPSANSFEYHLAGVAWWKGTKIGENQPF